MTNRQILFPSLVCCVAAVLVGCGGSTSTPPVEKTAAAPPASAIESVLPPGTAIERTVTFVSPTTQKSYRIESVVDDREEDARKQPPGMRDVPAALGAPAGDNFRGTARKAAKLSIASDPVETFSDVAELIATLQGHEQMVGHKPVITTTATSNRVKEEKRNVKVSAFLYAASREDDGDFHLILGTAKGAANPVYFTAELSGLPPSSSAAFPKLKAARDAFKAFFGNDLPGTSYFFYTPPIPVDVEGSLFFDMSHAKGSRPGPSSLRPKMPVVWEIHPITKIVLEP